MRLENPRTGERMEFADGQGSESFREEFRVLTPLAARLLFPILAWTGGRLGYRVP